MAAVASMTGFAMASRTSAVGTVAVELRSVNSRFLDLTVRVTDELRVAEAAVREAVTARVARGKVECRVSLQRQAAAPSARVNGAIIAQMAELARQVRATLPEALPPTVTEVLSWPGVVDTPAVDAETQREDVAAALAEALDTLQQTRQREGGALRTILLERCDRIGQIAAEITGRLPELQAAIERRLSERLKDALTPALAGSGLISRDELNERIRQEVTLYGLRADVDEELKRLQTHVAEVRRVLAAGGAVGRRLDFLMQELNREANTLGSKATAIEQTNAAVELKLAIEQMREQVQNLE